MPKGQGGMDPRQLFADARFSGLCVYCGTKPLTRDHVPSKVLLDEPFPENLPVVPACVTCNSRFSLDEEYVACLVECALTGSADLSSTSREKVGRILKGRPALASLIASSRHQDLWGHIVWEPDKARVQNVVLKLGRGHAAYECSEPQLDEPESISFVPLCAMSTEEQRWFETPPFDRGWPEIGSRAFHRSLIVDSEVFLDNGWHIVQPGRYRYLVSHSGPIAVRLVLSEYLACEVVW